MGIRKNAKLLTPAEREAFVRACVLMKADIVNPLAPAAQRYSRWDEYVAVHRMIQNANAPTASFVNFGHGGTGSYSFLSWHRYFLHLFELQLQGYVPGVMLPYWDWSDPATILTDTFLGPNGTVGSTVTSGYFAATAPGVAPNPTPAPPWWPAGLAGWLLPAAFPPIWQGALRRSLSAPASLPSAADIQGSLAMPAYSAFQDALESGTGLPSFPFQQMHNGLHGWIGGHMGNPTASPFDPIFYLHHCNIDRLWAMWQADGHADEYPTTGGLPEHHRNDIMYPWTGGAAGYSTNISFPPITMPDFSALGAKRNVDVLDFRAFGYTYDTLPVVGIGLDRTGSMLGMTPDPMTVTAPDVTKWEAARRGVSAFLQDCETVYASGAVYVTAGVKTFRTLGPGGHEFAAVFPGTPYGLVKPGGAYSGAVFDATAAAMTPGGGTPLVDALQEVQDTLVEPPFGGAPADERRYLAMLTDGMRTTGSLLPSIPDGSLTNTAVFAMGFGTGAEVDYATLSGLVAKGVTIASPQVFHGENAGTIDKFFSSALATAMGFTVVFDPVVEMFAGEHVHLYLDVTSADDALFVTAQGMDFADENWTFHVVGPDGETAHADAGHGHRPGAPVGHGHRRPHVTVRRGRGRLSLLLQRDSADVSAWVGTWHLMAAYRTTAMSAMLMPDLSELVLPVSAGPARGPRWARLLVRPEARTAARSVRARPRHRLDVRPAGTNRDGNAASTLAVTVHARTRLRLELKARPSDFLAGGRLDFDVQTDALVGSARPTLSFARLVAPTVDLRALLARTKASDVPKEARLSGSKSLSFDPALVLARLERKDKRLPALRDQEVALVAHAAGPLHAHVEETQVPGTYHLGAYVEGTYCPWHDGGGGDAGHDPSHGGAHDHGSGHGPGPSHGGSHCCASCCRYERFSRLLAATAALTSAPRRRAPARRSTRRRR